MTEFLQTFLDLLNETLASAIVIVSVSMLLYNLTRNIRDRVARTSSAVLASVTIVYVCDVMISVGPGPGTFEALLRLQWLGLALIPATLFHLSDALLATTGLPSRGRRRRVVRLLYCLSVLFILLAGLTDWLISPVQVGERFSMTASSLFPVYVFFFASVNLIAFVNVERARRRCLTRSTKRRMTYLQIAMPTPVAGIFPYSVLLGPGQEFTVVALLLVNLSNLIIILMLLFLAYPLSFFGSRIPDRVVKADLLRFMLRGPGTGLIALIVIIFIDPFAMWFNLPGETFLAFATVGTILVWQWGIDIAIPWLERRLVYNDQEDNGIIKFQQLNERFLSRADLQQLIEAVLASTCDYLRVERAFVAVLKAHNLATDQPEAIATTGRPTLPEHWETLNTQVAPHTFRDMDTVTIYPLDGYWMMPLYSRRNAAATNHPLIGFIGVEARSEDITLTTDEQLMLKRFVRRAAQALDDMLLQSDINAAIEGLLPQMALNRSRTLEVEYRASRVPRPQPETFTDRQQIIEQVHAALRHYWGGPGLSQSRLLELNIVQQVLPNHDGSAVKALRDTLNQAIERLRPPGERDMRSPEWVLYNILQLRFIEQRKARETAQRLYMAEASLYRKQNVAIEALADSLIAMERDTAPNSSF